MCQSRKFISLLSSRQVFKDPLEVQIIPKNYFFLQVLALAILWILKSTDASLIFPLMVLALVLFRKVMDYFPKVFSQQDLLWLDNLMPSSGDKKDEETEQESVEENKNVRKRFITFPKLWKVENELETNHINNVTLLKK